MAAPGTLVAPGDAAQLADAFTSILEDRDVAASMGHEGRLDVDARFSRERLRLKWRSMLASTLGLV